MELSTNTTVTLKNIKAIAASFLLTLILLPQAGLLNAGAFDALKELTSGIETPIQPQVPAPGTLGAVRPLKVYFISVGQGDSTYIELPNGANVLIDGGPSNSATSSLASFLSSHQVAKLDNVVLTHPHSDHFAGLQYVFSNLTVTNFFDTMADNTGSTGDDAVRAKAKSMGVNIVHPSAGDTLAWDPGEVQVKVLNSCSTPVSSSVGQVLNDCSIVLKVTYQNTSMLFTGDMQDDVEATLVKEYGADLRADVLKVGHHGSRYSSSDAFLAEVRPHDAYISVGTGNTYGFPTSDCLSRLQNAGAIVHRTDLDGTMEYTAGGTSSQASTADTVPPLKY